MPFLNYKPLKPQLRVFLAGYTGAMVTYYDMERTKTCSPIIGQCFDTMIVASSDKEWLQWPIEILVLETVLSYLKSISDLVMWKIIFISRIDDFQCCLLTKLFFCCLSSFHELGPINCLGAFVISRSLLRKSVQWKKTCELDQFSPSYRE